MGISRVKVVGHDWGGAVGAVYAMRYRQEVSRIAILESALAGAGFEDLWTFNQPNAVFPFIPFLLMGEGPSDADTTAALLQGRESIFLHHLWATFTGDKNAAPFAGWDPYVEAMERPGIARSSSSYYRAVYRTAEEVRVLNAQKLRIPVLAIAGEKGIGAHHEALIRAFAADLQRSVVLPGAGHFVAEERPKEVTEALRGFLAQ